MTSTDYDVIVIGAGQAGVPLAVDMAKAGRKTALIERALVGGACVNTACTPTKTMIASATALYRAHHAQELGIHIEGAWADFGAVRDRKRAVVERSRAGVQKRLDKTDGLMLISGEARFESPHELSISLTDTDETMRINAPIIVINTGTRTLRPPIEGLDKTRTYDEAALMEVANPPMHLIVLGGGYVGLEFAQMFRRFGSEVTLIERSDRLISGEDPDVSAEIASILRDEGIRLVLNTEVRAVQPAGEKYVQVRLPSSANERAELVGSHILLAVGRTPNTDALNLEAAGIKADDEGYIRVNDCLETSVSGVYALGDVNGGAKFTHVAYDDYRLLKGRLLHGESCSGANRLIPQVMFTDPQVARVGLTESQARERGRDILVARLDMKRAARAFETGETRGFMKAVIDRETDAILGFAIIGSEGGEIMTIVQVAMLDGLPYTALRDGLFAHPTLGESLNNLFMTLD